MDFQQTRRGAIFYDHHVPEIMKALKGIQLEMKRANDLKEQELTGSLKIKEEE